MDGENDGANAQGAAQAGAQGEDACAAQAQLTGDTEAVDDTNKACEEFEAALADRDARIAEIEGQIAEAAKTAESAEKLRAEMDELRRQGDEQRFRRACVRPSNQGGRRAWIVARCAAGMQQRHGGMRAHGAR